MEFDKAYIQEVLLPLLPGPVDEITLNYMIEVVQDLGRPQVTPEKLVETLGPFFEDAGCAKQEEIQSRCQQLSEIFLSNDFKINSDDPECADSSDPSHSFETTVFEPILFSDVIQNDKTEFIQKTVDNVNFNSDLPISDSVRLLKAAQREKIRQMRLLQEWENQKGKLPPCQKRHGDCDVGKLSDLILHSISVSIAGKELLSSSPLKLSIGRKYGLIGRNGIGKSTFLSALVRKDIPGISSAFSIGCVEQEVELPDLSVLECVLEVDIERSALLKEAEALTHNMQTEKDGLRLGAIYERLNAIDSRGAESLASSILFGLGFKEAAQNAPVKGLSGGWRARVILARALFSDPDILLLDEPTNHLDLFAVAWLANYLQNSPKTVIVVSHARDFLNDVCTDIIHFHLKKLNYYKGNYDAFEKVYAEKMLQSQREKASQEEKRNHVQQFINKFRYNAKRASLVQSRIKFLSKLPMIESVAQDPLLKFDFGTPRSIPQPMLVLDSIYFTYDTRIPNQEPTWILKDVSLSIDMDTRMAICGVNGCGKSTLLSIISGQQEPQEGLVSRHSALKIGYFAQHHVDHMDLTLSAVQQLQHRYPNDNIKEEEARTYLGRFGVTKSMSVEPLYILSGGQKSRVAIALMAYSKPQLLILDEPTNHLDLDATQALVAALNAFEGGIICVSHDSHLLSCVFDEIWHIYDESHTCKRFDGTFPEYRKKVLKRK